MLKKYTYIGMLLNISAVLLYLQSQEFLDIASELVTTDQDLPDNDVSILCMQFSTCCALEYAVYMFVYIYMKGTATQHW